MSWVFLVGERAFKLKKPVRFPYLYFSTLAAREADCLAELRLNRALAPGRLSAHGLRDPERRAANGRSTATARSSIGSS